MKALTTFVSTYHASVVVTMTLRLQLDRFQGDIILVYENIIIIRNFAFYASLLSDTLASRSSPFFWMYSSNGVNPPLWKKARIV